MFTICVTVDKISIQDKKNRLKYFQLEVVYCSNEANKNKYTNFQLIASTKTT